MSQLATASATSRPEISVYWQPGCSSCLKAKEFITEQGLEFESVNVLENAEGMAEVMAAGLRSIPVVRKGDRFIYAQSLDDIATLLGTKHKHIKLANDVLARRWDDVLQKTKDITGSFDQTILDRQVIPGRPRVVSELCAHVFQIAESFLRQVEDDSIDARAIYIRRQEGTESRAGLLAYIEKIHAEYRDWVKQGGVGKLPEQLRTHYGIQPVAQVLERGVWHSTQHARQLDFVAAGIGGELVIPAGLYDGLPLPKRLWA